MKFTLLALCASSAIYATAQAEIHGYSDTPKIPGTPYGVHDPARPQPTIVETAGAVEVQPPSDAIVLFDGKSVDAWENAWLIKDGAMVATGKDTQTKQSFGAIQLHFEWRLPADRPANGQNGGNSGVFLMGLYEVQILQSHRNQTYPDGQAGAMYGQLPPLVNATAPQGEWQSYDLTFEPPVYENGKVAKPAKLFLLHNGVVVQNGELFTGPTEHRKLAEYPGNHPETGRCRLRIPQRPNRIPKYLGQADSPEEIMKILPPTS
ncbi:MAG: DUF1080 domain-containing protein [Akkermansiaceae bacterium]|nr:DUF1080 domain-containing protein [Akkermansiaceae bacterium]